MLQTNNVQAMPLQSERMSEMNFSAIWIPKLKKKIAFGAYHRNTSLR